MRLLFKIDTKDYNPLGRRLIRPSARAIYIKNGLIAMVHSVKYNYYKFPGGGIEVGETPIDAVIREAEEEAGLMIIKKSIKEYGYVKRIQKSEILDVFEQDNFYYFVECENDVLEQKLDDYEEEEKFTLEFMNPIDVIKINKEKNHGPADQIMLDREAMVLEILIKEGYFK